MPTLFDWSNPDSWKQVTELATDWKTLSGIASGIIIALWKWGGRLWRWLVSKLLAAKKLDRPLRIVTRDHESHWSVATRGDEKGTMLHGRWDVTNISDYECMVLKARVEGYEAGYSHVFTRAPDKNIFGSYPVLAGRMSEVTAEFLFFPGIDSGRDPIVADVSFTDNYADEHRVRSVRFQYIGP